MALNRKERRNQEKLAKKQGLPETIESAHMLKEAITLHMDGYSEKAEPIYRKVLKLEPENPQANYYIGIIENEDKKNPKLALQHFLKAKKFMGERHDFHHNLGVAYSRLGRKKDAINEFEISRKIDPNNIDTLSNLIPIYYDMGEVEKSKECAIKLLKLDPENVKAMAAIATHAAIDGNNEEAEGIYRQLLEQNPGNTEHRYKLATVLRDKEEYAEALVILHEIMSEDPTDADAFQGFGDVLVKQEKYVDAMPYYKAAIELNPACGEAYSQVGYIQQKYFENDDAIKSFKKALELITEHKNKVSTMMNLGTVLTTSGRHEEAKDIFLGAIKLDPNNGSLHWNLCLIYQLLGNISQAWEEAKWRYKSADFTSTVRHFPQPEWDGSDLKGKSILLWAEQGIGDQVRFASIVPDVVDAGAKVSIECAPKLVKLFSRSFPEADVLPYAYKEAEKGEVDFDFQMSMYSLPLFLRNKLEDFPQKRSFLKFDPERQVYWKNRLSELSDRPKIGFTWRSALLNITRSNYFPDIEDWGPVLQIEGVDFINLQYDECSDELDIFRNHFGATIHTFNIDMKDDLAETVNLMSALDLVISSASAASDLSAGVGTDTMVFLPAPNHQAMLGTDHVPWQPAMKIYSRQDSDSAWGPAIDKMANEVKKILKLT